MLLWLEEPKRFWALLLASGKQAATASQRQKLKLIVRVRVVLGSIANAGVPCADP